MFPKNFICLCIILIVFLPVLKSNGIKIIQGVDDYLSSLKNLTNYFTKDEILEIFNSNLPKQFTKRSDDNTTSDSNSTSKNLASSIQDLSKVSLKASKDIIDKLAPGVSHDYLKQIVAPSNYCPFIDKPYCDFYYPYRTHDGSCNNHRHEWWGMSNSPYKRILHPEYDDGLTDPRKKSKSGKDLPNPREIAIILDFPRDISTPFSNLLAHFGQFVDHDMSQTWQTSDSDGSPISCFCNSQNPDCLNINMNKSDVINRDQRCMVFTRSLSSFGSFDCTLGPREQLNKYTHWLDLSQIYGNNLQESLNLRTLHGGKLNSSSPKGPFRPFLPLDNNTCFNIKPTEPCFKSGDSRVNQNLMLTALHTLWMREHNRIASIIQKLNPKWIDEQIYQEARRVLIAIYQNIIYSEWLPVVIGDSAIRLYGLLPLNQGYFYDYNSNIYANVANEFSTAAFRFGHTLVRDSFTFADENLRSTFKLPLIDAVFVPENAFIQGGIDSVLRGGLVDSASQFDPWVTDYLNNHLFEKLDGSTETHRFSLPAINVNRGRDHGIKGYNYYRSLCGLSKAKSFDDLTNIPPSVRALLAKLYDDVDDIDLFSGGVSEHAIENGLVGPTFACIIAKQFRDTKYGDRYYFENGHSNITKFTEDQLTEIRKMTMSRVLCNNIDLNVVQKNAFLETNDEVNPLMKCENIPDMSMDYWTDYS